MEGGAPERKRCSMEAVDGDNKGDKFEEMMCSAFKMGVELLSEPELDPVQSQSQTVESPSKSASEYLEDINGVPKNSTQLKPVIDKLMKKGLSRGADQRWRMEAKEKIQRAQETLSRDMRNLGILLAKLDGHLDQDYPEETD